MFTYPSKLVLVHMSSTYRYSVLCQPLPVPLPALADVGASFDWLLGWFFTHRPGNPFRLIHSLQNGDFPRLQHLQQTELGRRGTFYWGYMLPSGFND